MADEKKSKKAVLVDVKSGKRVVEFKTLEEVYKLIDCRLVEVVHATVGGYDVDILVDEEGLFVENPVISALCTSHMEQLHGSLIVVGYDGKDDWRSLTATESQHVLASIFTREHKGKKIPTLVYERKYYV